MKQYQETRQCDDGFTYEIWCAPGVTGTPTYYAAAAASHGRQSLAGGQRFSTPEELHKAMNLPR